jgi:ketosteroid isomerase-like protein
VPSGNVDVVRGFLDAYRRGEVDRWVAYLSPDVVLIEAREFPGATERYGREAALEAIADWALAWSKMSFVPDEFEDFGGRVLAIGRMHMRGERTGMAFENPAAFQFTVRDGSIARVEIFLDVEEGRRRTQESAASPGDSGQPRRSANSPQP